MMKKGTSGDMKGLADAFKSIHIGSSDDEEDEPKYVLKNSIKIQTPVVKTSSYHSSSGKKGTIDFGSFAMSSSDESDSEDKSSAFAYISSNDSEEDDEDVIITSKIVVKEEPLVTTFSSSSASLTKVTTTLPHVLDIINPYETHKVASSVKSIFPWDYSVTDKNLNHLIKYN